MSNALPSLEIDDLLAEASRRAGGRSDFGEPQFMRGLAFGKLENGSDPGVAEARDEGARPLGDGVAWHVIPL